MQTISCTVIGAGAAAHSVVPALTRNPLFKLEAVIDRSGHSFQGMPAQSDLPEKLPNHRLIILAVPDGALAGLVGELAQKEFCGEAPTVVHLSAATGLEVMAALENRGCGVGVLHPLQSFSSRDIIVNTPWWGICANDRVFELLHSLLDPIDTQWVRLREEELLPWHLSAVWVSNFLPALLAQALSFWPEAQQPTIRRALLPLMSTSLLHQVEGLHLNMGQNISGPLKRGDLGTAKAHLDWLGEHRSAAVSESYRHHSRLLLDLLPPEIRNRPDVVSLFASHTDPEENPKKGNPNG